MPILKTFPLGFPWQTIDPFLFCAHHRDVYPPGNERLGPAAALDGRQLGNDFTVRDGWRMYHGTRVPGFPQHPHCGFETVTLARRGFIDHSDSLGATARFGEGDVQWMTAGGGVAHSEMFPLLDPNANNHTELFQLWLNLPRSAKQAPAHFAMLWSETIPLVHFCDDNGYKTTIRVVAGALDDAVPPAPPPASWAANPNNHVAIWMGAMEPGATWTLPAGPPEVHRTLYLYDGDATVADRMQPAGTGVLLDPNAAVVLTAGAQPTEFVLLQGRAIGEPVAQYGPFVGNTKADIEAAIAGYRQTAFGGWPWPVPDPVHERGARRFARYPDGHEERPPGA